MLAINAAVMSNLTRHAADVPSGHFSLVRLQVSMLLSEADIQSQQLQMAPAVWAALQPATTPASCELLLASGQRFASTLRQLPGGGSSDGYAHDSVQCGSLDGSWPDVCSALQLEKGDQLLLHGSLAAQPPQLLLSAKHTGRAAREQQEAAEAQRQAEQEAQDRERRAEAKRQRRRWFGLVVLAAFQHSRDGCTEMMYQGIA